MVRLSILLRPLYTRCGSNTSISTADATPGPADAAGLLLRCLVGGSRSLVPGNEHLVDAMAVHVHHLEGEPLPHEAVARRGHALEVGHHHPAHGLVIPLLLVRQP